MGIIERRWTTVLGAACTLAAGVVGCRPVLPVDPEARIGCSTSDQCPADWYCNENLERCRPKDDPDQTAPSLQSEAALDSATEADATGAVVAVLLVGFDVTEPLDRAPLVYFRMGGGTVELEPTAAFDPTATHFEYRYRPTGTEPAGTYPLQARILDRSGKLAEGPLGRSLVFDPPALQDVRVFDRPDVDEENALGKADTSFRVRFGSSKPLAAPPRVWLEKGDQRVDLEQGTDLGSTSFEYIYRPGAAELRGTWPLYASLVDAGANRFTGPMGRALVFDLDPPGIGPVEVDPPNAIFGSRLLVVVEATEALAEPPRVEFDPPVTAFLPPVRFGNRYEFRLYIDSPTAIAKGTYAVARVRLKDLAGNEATVPASPGAPLAVFGVDPEPPGLVSPPVVTPARIGLGTAVSISFVTGESLDGELGEVAVRVGHRPAACGAYDAAKQGYTCTYTTTGAELAAGATEGDALVEIVLDDRFGNHTVIRTAVFFDFRAPAIAGHDLALVPAPGGLVSAVTALRDGAKARLSLTVAELLHTASTARPLLVRARCGAAAPLAFARTYPAGSADASSFVFELALSADKAAPDGPCDVEATGEDVAGNALSWTDPGALTIDRSAPASPAGAAADLVLYRRLPWGAQSTGGQKRWFVEGATDASGRGPAEPGATVIVWDDADIANATEAGRGTAGTDGSFGPVRLTGIDRERVYCTLVDGAGNPSDAEPATPGVQAAPVRRTAWVATLGGKQAGDLQRNPTRLEVRRHATGLLEEADAVEADAPERLAALSSGDAGLLRTDGRGRWQNLSAAAAPALREQGGMVWDGARGRVVLFGGYSARNDTWEWDGWRWQAVCDPGAGCTPPAGATFPGIAWDAARGETVIFGGMGEGDALMGEMWSWDGRRWRRRCGSDTACAGPTARRGPAMAHDLARGRVLMFGGMSAAGYSDQLWSWDGRAWTLLCGAGTGCSGPQGRQSPMAAYDAARDRLVVFGGIVGGGDADDLWEWDGTAWHGPLCGGASGCASPPGRTDAAMAFDSGAGRVLLFGGRQFGGAPTSELWSWSGAAWTKLCDGTAACPAPDARWGAMGAFDPRRNRLVVFGGRLGSGVGAEGTWEWDGAAWHRRDDASRFQPTGRYGHAAAWDEARGELVVFGGDASGNAAPFTLGWSATGWRYACGYSPTEPVPAACWAAGHPTAALLARSVFQAAPGLRTTMIFGGVASNEWSDPPGDEVWTWDGSAWTQRCGAGTSCSGPAARAYHALVWDSARGRAVLFGGRSGAQAASATYRDDTWLWDGAAWAPACGADGVCAVRPGARGGHAAAFDAARGRTVVFGGYRWPTSGPATRPVDTWEWNGTGWTLACDGEAGCAAPAARDEHAMAWEPARRRTVLFGGWKAGTTMSDETWTWDGARWTLECGGTTGCVAPLARIRPTLAATPLGGLLLYGGASPSTTGTRSELWLWRGGADAHPEQRWSIPLSSGLPAQAQVEHVAARWYAGGAGDVGGSATPGAELRLWDRGAWRTLDSNALGPEGGWPAAEPLEWSSSDAAGLLRALTGEERVLHLSVRPRAPNGHGLASVVSDYAEIEVEYRLP